MKPMCDTRVLKAHYFFVDLNISLYHISLSKQTFFYFIDQHFFFLSQSRFFFDGDFFVAYSVLPRGPCSVSLGAEQIE